MQKVAAALVAAQKAFGPALKSSSNPHFKSKYADLAACVEAVITGLHDNGIALVQRNLPCESGVCVETVFVHESGETMSSGPLHVPAAKNDPQGYGSALTYARRYSLMAACGIAPEDDDGNAASRGREASNQPKGNVATKSGAISATRIAFEQLPPDWQAWLREFAPDVENRFEQLGPQAAADLIQDNNLEADHIAGLWHLLSSKCRAAIDALTKSKPEPRKAA